MNGGLDVPRAKPDLFDAIELTLDSRETAIDVRQGFVLSCTAERPSQALPLP